MKIAIPSTTNNLDGSVDPRFGRCNYFVIVELKNMSFEAFENMAKNEGHGAGTMAAQSVINKKVNAVISSQFGPNAFMTLKAANIELYEFQGSIKEALIRLKSNQLTQVKGPSSGGHVGMGGGRGMGQGRGRNRN